MAPSNGLAALGGWFEALPFESLLIGHCLQISSMIQPMREKYLLSYWAGLLLATGGGVITSLLLDEPVPFFRSNVLGVTWTLCWWLMLYFPYSLVFKLHSVLPVRITTKSCMNVLRAQLLVSRVDQAVKLFPRVPMAPIVLGTLAACGGKFIVDAVNIATGNHAGQSEMAAPTFVSRSAFQGTLLYYVAVHVLRTIGPAEGGAIIVTLFVGHGIIAELTGWNLDFTYPFARLGHAISNTPMPELAGRGDAAASKGPAGSGSSSSKRKSKAGGVPSRSTSAQDLAKAGKADAKQA
ncbi:hypothetical protein WJX74_010431 [Apatococcus lobatus]|uniref:Uncharacterized protein n=1 Tax=Apatococcus lobatus TaxID=904363 RepID=A0AAW1Q679_9CHLO